MRDFFKPWRRKVGVVTLGLACMLMVGWVRSEEKFDSLSMPFIDGSYGVVSADQRLKIYRKAASSAASWMSGELSQMGLNYNNGVRKRWNPFKDQNVEWRWDCGEFSIATYSLNRIPNTKFVCCVIPHWSIILPLTLLSAWLLLSKPRQTATKPTTEPAPTTGA